MAKDDIGGVWRTVGGRRIFIKDGQSLDEAMKESGKFPNSQLKDNPESDITDKTGYAEFETGEEINEFFYYDDEGRGLLAKRNSEYGQWKRGLSDEEREALSYYTTDGYSYVNNYLRKYGEHWEDDAEMAIPLQKNLDSAISSYNLKGDIRVYRAIQPEAFEQYLDNPSKLIGTTYTDAGYMSSSPLIGSTGVNKDCVLEIYVPKGKGRGAYINEFAGKYEDKEYEFLLRRGGKYNIFGTYEKDGKIFMKMEMIDDG